MAKTTKKKPAGKKRTAAKPRSKRGSRSQKPGIVRRLMGWTFRAGMAFGAFLVLAVFLFAIVNPPTTPYMFSEARRIGSLDQQWVDIEDIAPSMARSVVAAEDANYCLHWGFDMAAIRDALEDGANRGASTLSQQVVKNVYLWQGRSWARKALEAIMTPIVELVWTKRRIVEVYLNVAEFGEGVFGVEAAARTYFRVGPEDLKPWQSARLAAVLPNPKERSANNSSNFVQKRARSIADGAATILADGRADCLGG